MSDLAYARLRGTDPGRWRAAASAWRAWAALACHWAVDLGQQTAQLKNGWSGTAASAAETRLTLLRTALNLFRSFCWEVDQVLSEFAAALSRAKRLLGQALLTAHGAGLAISDRGRVVDPRAAGVDSAGGADPSERRYPGLFSTPVIAATRSAIAPGRRRVAAGRTPAGATSAGATGGHHPYVLDPGTTGSGHPVDAATALATAQLGMALEKAATADAAAVGRLGEATAAAEESETPSPPALPLPACTATPAEVRRWWDGLTPEQRRWLVATEPGWLGPLDGVPAGFRDLANRLLLGDRRAEVTIEAGAARGADARRVRGLRHGLDRLEDRLADGDGPRAYLLRLDLAEEGRAVVALGDPDRAANVLTHVPGMTAGLASYSGELGRAERVAVRAAELGPESATSTVAWLDYDAPDFLDEAAGAGRAQAGAVRLRQFQEGLRATHQGAQARQTVLGHSYGSLVVGTAARSAGLQADSVVFVGSPGVGVDSAAQLHVPHGEVWSSTSRSDVIQYTAVSPLSLVEDMALSCALPVAGPLLAFGRPEDDLWFGRNPSDPGFGARHFTSQADGGHLGYWDIGRPALDGITAVALGRAG